MRDADRLAPQAESAWLSSERRLRALADSMPQLVWIATPDGVVQYYNARAREYAGLQRGADGTWTWQPILHPDDLQTTLAAWSAAVKAQSPYACEHRIRMADGAFRWHISRARYVHEDGEGAWFGTATDIHEQKIAEQDLRRALAIRDQVTSVVSHDLRNPLAVMSTSLLVLRKSLATEGAANERNEACLARLDRQVVKMQKLLDELLDVARLQAGQPLALERRACDLVSLAREAVEEHTSASHRCITLQPATARVVGYWDAARLQRVIDNLLSNAIKYSPDYDEITVHVEHEGECALLRVCDRGVGVAEQDRERIFEWFARGENVERTARGAGIGLAGARQIAEQHGGALTVDSELGVGSTFTLSLPLRTAT